MILLKSLVYSKVENHIYYRKANQMYDKIGTNEQSSLIPNTPLTKKNHDYLKLNVRMI